MSAIDERRALLTRLGVDGVEHNSKDQLRPHLDRTAQLLAGWGARQALVDAGQFHSIYGTEHFRVATVGTERREEVRAVIGEEAEALVWLWCFGRRDTLPPHFQTMDDRRSAAVIGLTGSQGSDLLHLWLADTLEQLERVPEREVPTARLLADHGEDLLPAARAALDDVLRAFAAFEPS